MKTTPSSRLVPQRLSFKAIALLALAASRLLGQGIPNPPPEPSRPGFDGFHSNLGIQEIIEVGAPLRTVAPPHTASPRSENLATPAPSVHPRPAAGPPRARSDKPLLNASLSAGSRLYYTSNVMRTSPNSTGGSGVYEFNVGASVGTRALTAGDYVTFLPRIEIMNQWAKYGDGLASDLLDYRFSMIKGSLAIGLPEDWSLGLGFEYDYLASLASGDRMFDATAPSFSIQKVVPFSETSFLMIDSMLKYSHTDRALPFVAEGIFADDGDNLQTTLNATYVQAFGPDGQILFMPSAGFTRTSYRKNEQMGRVDYLFTLGASGIYQFNQWLGLQTFLNYSRMFANEKGEDLLKDSSSFKAWDFGVALTGNYRF